MAGLTASEQIRGVWATVMLDVGADGVPCLESIEAQVEALAAAGVDGIYCNGTTTEFHCQTEDQFVSVASATAVSARRVGLPFQIGASHPMPQGTLLRLAAARALAPLAIQVTLPDWTPMREEEVLRFLKGCASAAEDVALVLYNPPHAKTVLSPDTLAMLTLEVPQLAGLKCAGGDENWYHAMAPVLKRISVFIPGHFYASGTQMGAHGSYSNMACLNPAAAVAWARQCSNDPEGAMDLEKRISAFMGEVIRPLLARGYFGNAVDKAMAVAGGWTRIGAAMMWPFDGVPAADIARIRSAARKLLPEFV
ncbi:dihydrodipicolinate synthase family protein [Martelella lutilitoris]|uniref:Dihydrodipicolinate synthase family protein n=1 Tax=Martelella lutilitoris TaxID=2583532 RepID=A0A7T7HMN8_9HYPH|nr:dihydrodipicolinate synthase family protein [Martelella lutilitoris]QQM32033.1 dihydrodipicolinate synthase family protein [Martelella lutilitoris]